ncbi:hypothetical protein [Streptomyces sp. LN785]|uniref:hypothetical protein n=1 Tax=Streptomyces sp. LN785 TaxID=3112983 RepID=UPI003713EE6D
MVRPGDERAPAVLPDGAPACRARTSPLGLSWAQAEVRAFHLHGVGRFARAERSAGESLTSAGWTIDDTW